MIQQWVDVTAKSAKAVASEMGFDCCKVLGPEKKLSKGLAGAFVPLVGQAASLQLGLMATSSGQEGLARIVLQMEPDEPIDRDEIADAVGELANCLVGRIKREMRKFDPTLKIGLPMFIEGTVEDTGNSEFRTLKVLMNSFEVSIVVVVGV